MSFQSGLRAHILKLLELELQKQAEKLRKIREKHVISLFLHEKSFVEFILTRHQLLDEEIF